MNRLTHCPFCNDSLDPEDDSTVESSKDKSEAREREQVCRGKDDHTYIQGYYPIDQLITKVLIRVGEGEKRYYMYSYFILPRTKVWSGRNDDRLGAVTIDRSIEPDFNRGLEGLKKQIKLYLTFA